MEITKIYLSLLSPLPFQDLGVVATPPPSPTFFTAKIFENFFHRYMGIWAKKAKMARAKIRKRVLQQLPAPPPPPPERED